MQSRGSAYEFLAFDGMEYARSPVHLRLLLAGCAVNTLPALSGYLAHFMSTVTTHSKSRQYDAFGVVLLLDLSFHLLSPQSCRSCPSITNLIKFRYQWFQTSQANNWIQLTFDLVQNRPAQGSEAQMNYAGQYLGPSSENALLIHGPRPKHFVKSPHLGLHESGHTSIHKPSCNFNMILTYVDTPVNRPGTAYIVYIVYRCL